MGCNSSKSKLVVDPGDGKPVEHNTQNGSKENRTAIVDIPDTSGAKAQLKPKDVEPETQATSYELSRENPEEDLNSTDINKKRYSIPQVENHIKSIVKQYGDDDLFEEEFDAFHAHVTGKGISNGDITAESPRHNSSEVNPLSLSGKIQLDWNQVMTEFMGSESPVVSAAQLSPLKGKNHSLNDSLFDDEFNIDSPTAFKPQNFSSGNHSSLTTATGSSRMDEVTLTFYFELPSNDRQEGYCFPLPMSSVDQKFIRYHSFTPSPILIETRRMGESYSDQYEVLYCQFEPDVKDVKFSVDMEVASKRKDNSFCIGKSTQVSICDERCESVQQIVKQQKWLQTESKEERIRQIAEYVGQLPYHLNLYDQIYYYLDSTQPSNYDGLRVVFYLFLAASNIKDSVDLSNLTGYIFPNLRENIFVKICYKEIVKIEILNRTNDNELEKIYL